LGAIAAIALAVACLGAIAALDGPKRRSVAPSNTTLAASTTLSTIASLTWTTAPPPSTEEPARTLRTVPASRYARHYRIGARCRDGWRSDATGSGACSWHGGVAEWLYADDRIVQRMAQELAAVRLALADQGQQAQYALAEERRANRHAETESRRSRLDARQVEHRQQQPNRAVLATGKKQAREQERHNRKVLQELKRQARDTRRRR
jgi:hypothetical protein